MLLPSTRIAALGLGLSLLAPAVAFAGPVTPTAVTFTFNSISLVAGASDYRSLTTSTSTKTFRRADPDFEGTTLSDVDVPYGRYTGLSVCYQSALQILLDGVTYQGYAAASPGGVDFGTRLWTTASGVTATDPGTAAPYTYVPEGSSAQWCTTDKFMKTLCVVESASDAASDCKPGDDVYTAQGKLVAAGDGGQTTDAQLTLRLYLMTDLYNSVEVDPSTLAVRWGPSIHATVGEPGAALHLTATDGQRNTADVGFLFAPDSSLIWAQYSKTDGAAYPGMCAGQSSVYLTAQPATASFDIPGICPIGLFDAAQGMVIGPILGGPCLDESDSTQCVVVGDNRTTGLLQGVDRTAQLTCIPDSQGPFEAMGYAYRTSPQFAGDGSSVPLTIARIVDPGNLLGTCTSGFVEGHSGTCAKTGNGADGYPQ